MFLFVRLPCLSRLPEARQLATLKSQVLPMSVGSVHSGYKYLSGDHEGGAKKQWRRSSLELNILNI